MVVEVPARRLFHRRAGGERSLFRVPLLGSCLAAIVMTRFCVALRLMLETNLSIRKALRLALLATDNQVYMAAIPAVDAALRRGNSITESLTAAGVFPPTFLGTLAIAEESGRLTEAVQREAERHDDLARRRLAFLNRVASWAMWFGIATFIVMAIYQIFMTAYVKNIER